ncbi:efflux RND transporter periplasmic adaptor subunit [Desulfovibrio aminophilus]|nr:efflux RND transporter periplasmic adaptor subunit [Desulfovibrio aminophilus]MCM0753880.1 efflux RND transporter periplasmic adaptor subunit [Desulfovibrio aminophilus]
MSTHSNGLWAAIRKRRSLLLLTLAAVTAIAALATCREESKTQASVPVERKKIKVVLETVAPRPLSDLLILPGETEALHDVRLSAERNGRVEQVPVKEGDFVRAGQVIAHIDMQALSAGLDKAQAACRLAEDLHQRRSALHAQGMIAREDLQVAETDLAKARSDLLQARSNHRQGSIMAPVNGMINKVHVDPGEVVSEGNAVADLVNVDTIRVNVNVPELDVRFLRQGQEAPVNVDAYPGENWKGVVDFVAYKADPATKTFQARLVVANTDRRIRPGMLARVIFHRRTLDGALTAPLSAILDKSGERLVFVEENGVARARTVVPGVIDGDRVEIRQGLKAGDRLIVVGQTEVEDGAEVQAQ